jgi:hypothetical protein
MDVGFWPMFACHEGPFSTRNGHPSNRELVNQFPIQSIV